MSLTPEQTAALIRFAEQNPELMDALLSCDCENIAFLTDDSGWQDPDDMATIQANHDACAALRRTLKQVETV